MSKIEINNVYKIFGNNPKSIIPMVKDGASKEDILEKTGHTVGLDNVSLKIEEGETFVCMGLSGSGKSTLIRHLNRLIDPTEGEILVEGTNVLSLNQEKLIVPFSIQREDGSIEYLSEVKVESDGRILASYDFEKDQEIGQVLLAKFDNEADLFATGNNKYIASDLSGQAELGGAMTGGFGEIQAGSLEMSNVIITDELVSLIKAQQAFNGAAKILQTEIDISKKFTG